MNFDFTFPPKWKRGVQPTFVVNKKFLTVFLSAQIREHALLLNFSLCAIGQFPFCQFKKNFGAGNLPGGWNSRKESKFWAHGLISGKFATSRFFQLFQPTTPMMGVYPGRCPLVLASAALAAAAVAGGALLWQCSRQRWRRDDTADCSQPSLKTRTERPNWTELTRYSFRQTNQWTSSNALQ